MNISALAWLGVGLLWLALVRLLRRRETRRPAAPAYSWDVLAGGALLLLTAGFFWRTISGDVFQPADGGDLVSFLFPTYRFAAAQVAQGSLPLWNPTLYGGAPFISDIQAGFLYPPNLLLFLLKPDFGYPILQWLSIGHLYWAGLGVYVLVRVLRPGGREISRPAALFAALAFQFSDPLLLHLGNLNLIAVLSWLPWVLAAFHLALTRRSTAWAVLAGVLFAIANYAGHAPSTVFLGMAIGFYWIGWVSKERLKIEDKRLEASDSPPISQSPNLPISNLQSSNLQSSIFNLFIVIILAGLLTAPILLPAFQLTAFTERSDFVYQDTVAYSLAPVQAIGLITPGFFGRGPALHWGLWDRVELPYAGVAALLLALGALLIGSRRTRRDLVPWMLLAAVGFLAGLGIYAIIHGWLTLVVPGFDQFRAPARALVLWTLGVAVLSAAGLDAIAAWGGKRVTDAAYNRFRRLLQWGGLLLAGVFVPLMYLALLLTQSDSTAFLRASVASLAMTLAAGFWLVTWALIALRRGEIISPPLFAGLVIALLFLDLSATGAYTDISPNDPAANFQHPEIIAFLHDDPDRFRIDTRTDIADLWQPDAAALHGLEDVWGVANPLMLEEWNAQWEATGGRQTRRYDALNVKYVLVRDGTPLPDGKFELALDAPGDLSVYRNLDFWPRAWLVHDLISSDAAHEADPTVAAVMEENEGQGLTVEPAVGEESVHEVSYGASVQSWRVNADAPGLLVMSETWYPGWRATVNGAEMPVLRVNGAQRAVAVAAGESLVTLRFAPQSWRVGLLLFGVGIVLAALLLWIGRKRTSHGIQDAA
ncbi:MAG: hypothetical protein H6642_13635 [Caldilineaceae bacterium]|nr:hypothetical protein [Caldilineaceae bacterium]